jgi:CDP-glucose 4,6-dehydratase
MINIRGELSDRFRDRTVLVTGHTGFKGTWLTLWLESLGARVIGYSLDLPTDPSFFNESGLSGKIEDIRGDILDRERLERTVTEFRPDYIFHLAAQPLVRKSYENPCGTFETNIMGTANLLEAIRVSGLSPVCVCVTSDKCYENHEWDYAYRENDPMGGHDPYSASKGAVEIVISSYRRSFFHEKSRNGTNCALASVRAGNIIGGGDWASDRLVPDCIRSLVSERPIEIRNPRAVRPWQYVLDPIFGYLWLSVKMKGQPGLYSEAWNFGPDYSNNIDVRELTGLLIREWGCGVWNDISGSDVGQVHEAGYLKLDIVKARTKLGWKPLTSIDEAIRKTIGWYKNFYERPENCAVYSIKQIDDYLNCADAAYQA